MSYKYPFREKWEVALTHSHVQPFLGWLVRPSQCNIVPCEVDVTLDLIAMEYNAILEGIVVPLMQVLNIKFDPTLI